MKIAEFVGRRGRYAEIVVREIGRRLGDGGEHGQAPPCIPDVRAVRVAAQIRPISWRSIGQHGAPPDDFLAAHGDHCGDAWGVRRIRIDGKELLVAVDAVAFERRSVGIVDAREIADRFSAHVGYGHDMRRRWGIGRALGQVERRIDLRDGPRYLGTLGDIADPQPQP